MLISFLLPPPLFFCSRMNTNGHREKNTFGGRRSFGWVVNIKQEVPHAMGGHHVAAGGSAPPNAQGEEHDPLMRGAMPPKFRARAPTRSRERFLYAHTSFHTPDFMPPAAAQNKKKNTNHTPTTMPCRCVVVSCRGNMDKAAGIRKWGNGSGATRTDGRGPPKKSAANARTRH